MRISVCARTGVAVYRGRIDNGGKEHTAIAVKKDGSFSGSFLAAVISSQLAISFCRQTLSESNIRAVAGLPGYDTAGVRNAPVAAGPAQLESQFQIIPF